MKANVPQLRELVLLYGLDEKEERGTAVRRLLESMKIPAKTMLSIAPTLALQGLIVSPKIS